MVKWIFACIVGVFGGLFCIVCAYKDCDWFMTDHKAQFMCKVLGRKGARIFYMALGSALVVLGVLTFTGGVPPRS